MCLENPLLLDVSNLQKGKSAYVNVMQAGNFSKGHTRSERGDPMKRDPAVPNTRETRGLAYQACLSAAYRWLRMQTQ
jgi:hypothetical protein